MGNGEKKTRGAVIGETVLRKVGEERWEDLTDGSCRSKSACCRG